MVSYIGIIGICKLRVILMQIRLVSPVIEDLLMAIVL